MSLLGEAALSSGPGDFMLDKLSGFCENKSSIVLLPGSFRAIKNFMELLWQTIISRIKSFIR